MQVVPLAAAGPRLRHRGPARRQRLHRRVRRRPRLRRAASRGARRGDRRSPDVTGLVLSALTFVVFGAAILGPALGVVGWESVVYAVLSLTVVRMLPVAVALLGTGARRPTVALQRLVRPARAGVDRLRGDRPRRGRPPSHRDDHRDDRADCRALGRRARRHGATADRRVRALVRVASEAAADGKRAGTRAALAVASPGGALGGVGDSFDETSVWLG